MKIVAMVPVKMHSERVKNKNIRPFFDGKPLISFITEAVSGSKLVDEVYVYCSDCRISDYLPPNIKVLKRPEFLDENNCNCNDIIREFVKIVDADLYLVSHATAPFTKTDSIDKCIKVVANHNEYDSAVLVKKIQTFLWSGGKAINFNPAHFPRTQDLKPIYMETSGAYVFTREVFQKYGMRYGMNPCLVEADEIESMDIDTEEEMTIAQAVYKWQIEQGLYFQKGMEQ